MDTAKRTATTQGRLHRIGENSAHDRSIDKETSEETSMGEKGKARRISSQGIRAPTANEIPQADHTLRRKLVAEKPRTEEKHNKTGRPRCDRRRAAEPEEDWEIPQRN